MKPENRAKKLAQRVLKTKDFDLLHKQGFLPFRLKIKPVRKKVYSITIYLSSSADLFLKRSKKSFIRLCAIFLDDNLTDFSTYTDYDKIIGYYLYLKDFQKRIISLYEFEKNFNILEHSQFTLKEIKLGKKYIPQIDDFYWRP